MKAQTNIWELLVGSGLISSSQISEIRTRYEGDSSTTRRDDPEAILKWLRKRKNISGFQMQVLASGLPGPFRFEQYQIHGHDGDGGVAKSYRAVHVPSNHRVRLSFVGGKDEDDARNWHRIRNQAMPMTSVVSPFVSRLFEVAEVENYRFLVSEDKPGQTMTQKLPYKGRLPWPQSCQAAEQLSLGLAEIHRAGLAHGRIWPGAIWLLRGGICQLIWQIPGVHYDPAENSELRTVPDEFQSPLVDKGSPAAELQKRQRHDLYSLGAVIFRLVTGRAPKIKASDGEKREAEVKKHLALCNKYEVPESVQQVLRLLLTADLNDDLKDSGVTAKLIGTILESQSLATDVEPEPPSLDDYLAAIDQKSRSMRFIDQLESLNGSRLVANDGQPAGAPAFDLASVETTQPAISSRERLVKKRNQSTNRLPLILGGTILVAAVLMGAILGGLFSGNSKPDDGIIAPERVADAGEKSGDGLLVDAANTDPESKGEGVENQPVQPIAWRPQTVVEDDGQLLWESPTGAEPIDVRFMPAAPEFIFTFRPNRLVANPDAKLFLQALGPRFQELQEKLLGQTGLDASEIAHIAVSLHSTPQRQYNAFAIIELASPMDSNLVWEKMGKPESAKHAASGTTVFSMNEISAFIQPQDEPMATTIVIGPTELLLDSLNSSGLAAAGRELATLIERSDRDRDINVLFRNIALLSEEGTWLFDGELAGLRRPLGLFFDDRMQAVKISLHFDGGTYLELMTEQTRDLPDKELVERIPELFDKARNDLTGYVAQLPPHPYWASVQQRFDNMLNELVLHLRVGRETQGVTANCWLPSPAAHNLVTAGELVLNGPRFGIASAATTSNVPKTLDELLGLPRDLLVTNDPDLINLMREIEQEIKDDYPTLPFDFRIRLLGQDLAVDGITQTQRPGRVEATQVPLAEILAQIMLQANPDKAATSPADELCNLVWLIGPDPDDPGTQAVLVTTRKAAANRGLTLPKVFQPE